MVKAIFPGTFDPIHYGHIDIAERAACLFDELIIGVYDRPLKNLLFSPEERIEMVRGAFKKNKSIRVMGYSDLTVDFSKSFFFRGSENPFTTTKLLCFRYRRSTNSPKAEWNCLFEIIPLFL